MTHKGTDDWLVIIILITIVLIGLALIERERWDLHIIWRIGRYFYKASGDVYMLREQIGTEIVLTNLVVNVVVFAVQCSPNVLYLRVAFVVTAQMRATSATNKGKLYIRRQAKRINIPCDIISSGADPSRPL